MNRKSVILVSLLLCILLLTGCGASESRPAAAEPAGTVSTEPTANAAGDKPEVSETVDESVNPEAIEEITGSIEVDITFGLDETVVYEGVCEMSGLYSEVLDDAAVADGWYYYYTDTDESPAEAIKWKLSDGNYTTAEVLFTVKNISSDPQTFGDRITARMIYQESADSRTDCYDGTVFQQNPGQVDESGGIIMWSTKPVEIAPGESANVSFRFDIPKDVYDKVYATATGEDTGIAETCEFGFGDGTTYVINLAEVLIPASQY